MTHLPGDTGAPETSYSEIGPVPGQHASDNGVHVLLCANCVYFQHLAVAAVSLAENSGRTHVQIHVMTCDHDEGVEAKLLATLRPYPNVVVTIYRVEDDRLQTMFVDKHLTKDTYLRFLAPDILPDSVSRVIYLDSDLVVLDDIGGLWDIDLAGNPLGAVPELDWWGEIPEQRMLDLGFRPGHRYVNAGVLVMDLDAWRRERISDQLFAFVSHHGERLTWHDQDALNILLQGRITLLPRRWNVQTLWYTHFVRTQFPKEYRETAPIRRSPAILHYSTKHKPWKFRVWTRKRATYFRFLARTAWGDELPPNLTHLQCIEERFARALLRAGVDIYVMTGIGRRILASAEATAARLRLAASGASSPEDARP